MTFPPQTANRLLFSCQKVKICGPQSDRMAEIHTKIFLYNDNIYIYMHLHTYYMHITYILYIYIYMLLCSISGRFFFANRFKNAFFCEQVTYKKKKKTSSSGESYPVMRTTAAQCPPGVALQCVQKRGAYVAQHKHPIIEWASAGHF